MESRSHVPHTTHLNDHSDAAVLVAARRMVELAETAIPNLSVSRTITWHEASMLAQEMRPVRRALERLDSDQTDMAAALHVDRVLPVLDSMLSSRLWALSPPMAEEWRGLRNVVFGPNYELDGLHGTAAAPERPEPRA